MTTLPNLRDQISRQDRLAMDVTIQSLAEYIVPLLIERQKGRCNVCGIEDDSMDVDHIVYHPRLTLNELQLLCRKCHIAKHPNAPCLRAAPIRRKRLPSH